MFCLQSANDNVNNINSDNIIFTMKNTKLYAVREGRTSKRLTLYHWQP